MSKILFLHFFELYPHSGVSKKVLAQVNAFEKLGHSVELSYIERESDGTQKRMVGEVVIESFSPSLAGKFKKWFCFKSLTNYLIEGQFDMLYVRSYYNSSPSMITLFKTAKKRGIKVIVEYPTYPYRGEFANLKMREKIPHLLDSFYKRRLKKVVERSVTFSNYDEIDGVPTIKISNGVDFENTVLKSAVWDRAMVGEEGFVLRLIAVANIYFWHGIDRAIVGLANYLKEPGAKRVILDVVGEGDEETVQQLKELGESYQLEEALFFHGNRDGKELDALFEQAHFGIASLGRHRSGITRLKTLKVREYAARGIPFIYSEMDEEFDDASYTLKAPMDDSPLDIGAIVNFMAQFDSTPAQIRASVEGRLSWEAQLSIVMKELEL